MKRFHMLLSFTALSAAMVSGMFFLAPRRAPAQGLAGSPEQQAAQAQLESTYPQMKITDQYLRLSIPGYTMGQTVGVAINGPARPIPSTVTYWSAIL